MNDRMTRREAMRLLAATGAAAGLGSLARPGRALGDPVGEPPPPDSAIVPAGGQAPHAAAIVDGKVIQPQRELAVLDRTDVLVVGGGPAGVAAAIAARRTGAAVTLVERYGHYGGLWTGGLVVLVLAMHAKGPGGKVLVTQGLGKEMVDRLAKLDRGVIDWKPGVDPTVDAEALKYLMVEMIVESGVRTYLHCWGVDAIVGDGAVRGAVFESKSGRQAILAKVVVDATGDGDIFAAAGAEHVHVKQHHVGLVCRIGGLDRVDAAKAQGAKPRGLGRPTPVPGVNWVNMRGPDIDGLDLAELTRLELAHRRQIWKQVEEIRKTPGYEAVSLLETAPQLGVRITRILDGVGALHASDISAGTKFADCIGVGGSDGARLPPWEIAYGTLVPKRLEGLLAAGRCIAAEPRMFYRMRLIPTCFVTGHAAGVAAALAVQDRCPLRSVEIAKLQKTLRDQGAYLG